MIRFFIILTLILFLYTIRLCAQVDTLGISDDIQKNKWYQSRYIKESIAPVSLAAGSVVIMAIPNLRENLQEKICWNNDQQPGYINMGDDFIRYVPTAATYILGDLLRDYGFQPKHRFIDRTVIITVSYILSDFVVHNTKNLAKVTRPGREPGTGHDNSFPSQHTAMAFVGATFLHHELGHISPWISVGGYLVASYVGYSRIARNRHWTSDVFMGAAVGILMTNATYWAYDGVMSLFKKGDELSVAPYFDIENTVGVYACYKF